MSREEQLEYCGDFFREFVEFAQGYVPEIVEEFCARFDWRLEKWRRGGVKVGMGRGAQVYERGGEV